MKNVHNFLKGLGGTADEVAASLLKLGAKGTRCIPYCCPISRALQKECRVIAEVTAYHASAGKKGTWRLPKACTTFVQRFDSGQYEELVKEWQQPCR